MSFRRNGIIFVGNGYIRSDKSQAGLVQTYCRGPEARAQPSETLASPLVSPPGLMDSRTCGEREADDLLDSLKCQVLCRAWYSLQMSCETLIFPVIYSAHILFSGGRMTRFGLYVLLSGTYIKYTYHICMIEVPPPKSAVRCS